MADQVCSVSVTSHADTVNARLDGEFDLAAVRDVSETLVPHLHRHVVIDMQAVGFFDSSGVHCLLHLRDEAARRGGRVTLRSVSQPVRRVLDIVGLSALLTDS